MSNIEMSEFLVVYEKITRHRFNRGEIKEKTLHDYLRLIAFCKQNWGHVAVNSITVSDITDAVHEKALTAPHTARRLRINLSNLFMEAQREGAVPLGYNPALASLKPKSMVKTTRLTLPEWEMIFKCAKYSTPDYFQNAMLLALITAQRPSDIVKMHSNDIQNDRLLITQYKTGAKISLPIKLTLNVISTSLEEVIEMCASTRWLICNKRGERVNTWSLSRWFKICREQVGITATEGYFEPTFREQRSLSERLYRIQGVDTRTLLGHKYQSMTDSYNDPRGKEYRSLLI